MKSNYPACIKIILGWEIGPGRLHANTDNPGDRRTRDGVTQPSYDRWRRENNLSRRDVFLMGDAERDSIYKQNYWDLIDCDALAAGLDLLSMDCVVNGSEIKLWLAETAHLATVARIEAIDQKRRGFWRHCPNFIKFRLGWFRREDDILKHALAMASAN